MTAVLAAALVATAGAAGAQEGHAHGGMHGAMADCPMHAAMMQGPAAALRHAEALALTPQQVARLEAARDQAQHGHAHGAQHMAGVHQELAAAAAGETFDEARARAAIDRMSAMHAQMMVGMLRAHHETIRTLDAQQRARLQELAAAGHGEHGAGGHGGMMHCPMMMMHGGMQHGQHGGMQHGQHQHQHRHHD
jgi:Spy/CpxP family protein refolding chaperone